MASPASLDAGVRLWAVVTRLCARRRLAPRDQVDLRMAALAAIAAINGHPIQGGPLGRDEARAAFVGLATELARAGIDNSDLAAWLDESWADRRMARREA